MNAIDPLHESPIRGPGYGLGGGLAVLSPAALGDMAWEAYLYAPPENNTAGKGEIARELKAKAETNHITLSDIEYDDVTPDDGRIAGNLTEWPVGTRVMIGTARITGMAPLRRINTGFLLDLTVSDLRRLRQITRQIAGTYGRSLNDAECDLIIAEQGPKSAEKALAKRILDREELK